MKDLERTLQDSTNKVAGVPTNINFLQKLANNKSFEDGDVETHFIDNHKDDLFIDPENSILAMEAFDSAKFSATLVAACLCEEGSSALMDRSHGSSSLHSIWYSHPPFRLHHLASQTMVFEWENEYDSNSSKPLTVSITYQPDGKYKISMEEIGSCGIEVKAKHLHDHKFMVEADGVNMNVSLVSYSKYGTKHIHIWHGPNHHHFRQKLGLDVSDDEETQRKSNYETSSYMPGTVVAPMAGLVVKVLAKDGSKVDNGQPVLLLEAMKMEHVVKAPSAGYVHGLRVTTGQQVPDSSVLFSIKAE